jgi:DNA-binding response OmpR family regulator
MRLAKQGRMPQSDAPSLFGGSGRVPAPIPIRAGRLLVVEDDGPSLAILRRLFEMEGYSVVGALSACQAMELAVAHRCDLVISDVDLPDRSGLELMRELRDRHGLRGIAMSGYTEARDAERAHDAGFQHFIEKPIHFDTLIRRVREMVA